MAECAVPFCGQEEGPVAIICKNNHALHQRCLIGLIQAANNVINDGTTTSELRCPLCRDAGVLTLLRDAFTFVAPPTIMLRNAEAHTSFLTSATRRIHLHANRLV